MSRRDQHRVLREGGVVSPQSVTVDWDSGSIRTFPTVLNLSLTEHADATIAELTCIIKGHDFSSSGASKRGPGDKPNAEIGAYLAVGRALAASGRKMIKVATGLDKQANQIKMAKQRKANRNSVKETVVAEVTVSVRPKAPSKRTTKKSTVKRAPAKARR